MNVNFDLSLLEEDEETPLSVHEDIIKYLREQDLLGADEGEFFKQITSFTEDKIHDILEELLQRFELTQSLKEDYDARAKAHNQQPLFDLKTVLPDFKIDDEIYEQLTFRESLVIYTFRSEEESTSRPDEDSEPRPVGGLCLDVQKASGCPPVQRRSTNVDERIQNILYPNLGDFIFGDFNKDTDVRDDLEDDLETQRQRACTKFLVHVSSEFDVKGFTAGSRITSWIDRNVHTLEELRKEFLTEGSDKERKQRLKTLYCGLMKRYYYIRHTSSVESIEDRKFYSLSKARDFISEGANFLLLRYLAVTKFVGSFELSAMYINGDMCRNIYVCTGSETVPINDTKVEACRIHRTIIEECGLQHKCFTLLTTQGQILEQKWEGINYSLRINPLAVIRNEKPTGNERILFKHTWEKDMQLMSKYLDEKATKIMKIRSYMLDHPEFKTMMSDYVHAILLMKPEDIIDFTTGHFLSFAPQYIQSDYFY